MNIIIKFFKQLVSPPKVIEMIDSDIVLYTEYLLTKFTKIYDYYLSVLLYIGKHALT